jgi:cell division protein FtsW
LLWLISVVLLFLLPFLGRTVNGATRWYSLGGFSFNPAEPAKIALIIFLSDLLVRKKKNVEDVKEVIYPVIFILYIVVIGILMQKDLSTAILMVMLGLSMLYLAGARLIHISAILGVNFLVGLIMVLMFPYRLERIVAFFDPSSASPGALYQPTQSLIALGNGGLIGVGLGNSFQKYFFLPEAHTDYILSILGEEWGFLGVTVIMAIYFVIFWRGVKIARKCGDHFKSLLAWGITLNFVYYGLLHMMIVSHMVPSTGIGLPFMSYGGSALLVNSLLAGLLLNISADKEEQSGRFGVPEGWQDVEMEV